MSIADFHNTIFIDQMSAWYDKETKAELVGIKTWDLLQSSVDVFGIHGLDKLLCFMIVKELQQFISQFRRELKVSLFFSNSFCSFFVVSVIAGVCRSSGVYWCVCQPDFSIVNDSHWAPQTLRCCHCQMPKAVSVVLRFKGDFSFLRVYCL